MQKITSFILNRITGLFFLAFFCFSLISLLSKSAEDPYLGSFVKNETINNLFGLAGSYFAGTIYAFFGYSAYFIPIVFLIIGFKKTFGIQVIQINY